MKFIQNTVYSVLLLALFASNATFALTPAQRRQAVLDIGNKKPNAESIAALVTALEDDNRVVRRTAVRLLVRHGQLGLDALAQAPTNTDPVVRLVTLRHLAQALGQQGIPHLERGLADANAQVRLVAIEQLVVLTPRTEHLDRLITIASNDTVEAVRNVAVRALWPFYRETVFTRDAYDLDLQPVATLPLPKDGWRFNLDPQRNGHIQKWYATNFDDSTWDPISIEQVWQEAGYQYIGVTWYRRAITLPEEIDHLAVEIHFGGVDESAWVWLNGEYVGQHDIGPDGWNIPFRLDITDTVRWGQDNLLVVRAMNTRFAGGIWKPVRIEVLK